MNGAAETDANRGGMFAFFYRVGTRVHHAPPLADSVTSIGSIL